MNFTIIAAFVTSIIAMTEETKQSTNAKDPITLPTTELKDLISPEKKEYVSKKLTETIFEIERIALRLEDAGDIINELKQTEVFNLLKKPILNLENIFFQLREKTLTDQANKEDLKKIFRKSKFTLFNALYQLLKINEIIFIIKEKEVEDIVKESIEKLFKVYYMFIDMIKHLDLPEKNNNDLDVLQNDQPDFPSYDSIMPQDFKEYFLYRESQNIDDFIRFRNKPTQQNSKTFNISQSRIRLTYTTSRSRK